MPNSFVEIKGIYFLGHFWWALADIHDLDRDIWYYHEGMKFESEPTEGEAIAAFQVHAAMLEEEADLAWGRRIFQEIASEVEEELYRAGRLIFLAIVTYPAADIDQISDGVALELGVTLFDIKKLIQGIMRLFNFASFADFKQWVIDNEDKLRGEWDA